MAKAKTTLGIQPTASYLLIQPDEERKTTKSGIVLPDTYSAEKPQHGIVIAVGEATPNLAQPCKIGDTVIYKKWGGNEYKPVGSSVEYTFVKFDDILGIITN